MRHKFHIKLEIERDFTVEQKNFLMELFEEKLNYISHYLLDGGRIKVGRTPTNEEIAEVLSNLKSEEEHD
jgi:hypothetical protein